MQPIFLNDMLSAQLIVAVSRVHFSFKAATLKLVSSLMIATLHFSHSRKWNWPQFSSTQFFKLLSQKDSAAHIHFSPIRYLSSSSSEESKTSYDSDDDEEQGEEDGCPHVRPNTIKTNKKAKSMAQLIISNPWSSDLESSLSSLSPSLSKTTVLQVLRFIKTPSKALQFFHWAQQVGFTHDDQSFFFMLGILSRNRNLNVARNFLLSIEKKSNGSVKLQDKHFNSLIRRYGQAGLFLESINLFSSMKSVGVPPSVFTFNSLLSILLKRGRTNMAKSLFDEMLNTYGVTPDTCTFNTLIRGFCKNSMVEDGFWYFKEMSRCNCDPDVVTYNTLVDGLCRAGKVRIAHNVLKGMANKSAELSPNVVTYTTLLRGYCMKQEVDEALVVFEEMIRKGLRPNEITYNTLIMGLCETQKFDKIKEILARGGFSPDTCTFNTLMHAHCRLGNMDEALKTLKNMKELKVQPDSATFSILIRSLCERRDFGRAEQLFNELMEKEILVRDNGCQPLVAAYNPIFEFLCENGKTSKAETLFWQLMKRGTQDPPSYKILIMGHCREGTYESGYELLVLMLRRDFVPDFETYESLIDGLLRKGEPILAYQTLEKMLKSSHLPKTSTFHSILAGLLDKGCALESASFILLMLDSTIRQNVKMSTDTVKLLLGHGLREKSFDIVTSLYNKGYVVDMDDLIGFLCQTRRFLEALQMLLFCLEKEHHVDVDMYNTVVKGLCKRKKFTEAFGLYYELVEKQVHQQLSCLEDLRIGLEATGRVEEAKFVAKRMPSPAQQDISPVIISRIETSTVLSCTCIMMAKRSHFTESQSNGNLILVSGCINKSIFS